MRPFKVFEKKPLIFLLVSSMINLLLATCSSSKEREKHDTGLYLSLDQAHEDLSMLTKQIESGVPEPFYYSSSRGYDSLKTSAFGQLKDSMSVLELFRVMYPLIQSLNDAHFAVYLPDAMLQSAQVHYLPLRVIINGDGIYVAESLSHLDGINTGDTIISINGVPSEEIIKSLSGGIRFRNTEDRTFFEYRSEPVFHKRLYPLFGFKDTFEVRTSGGTFLLDGVEGQDMEKEKKAGYEFRLLTDEIGYLKINSLVWNTPEDRDSLKNFLKDGFNMLTDQSVFKLIVDVRGNMGGSSILAKDVLDYFTDQPYTLSTGVDYFHNNKRLHNAGGGLHTPHGDRFTGTVLLLSDVLTYSSAHMMQVGFKHYGMGLTVGQRSTEALYITGEIKQTILKNSGIELISPTVNFLLPGYSADYSEYYIPDHVLYPTLSDRLNNNDVLLSKSIELLQ